MHYYYPFLEITDPQGNVKKIELVKKYPNAVYSIGRYPPPANDIELFEDKDELITRIDHCILEKECGGWFIKDISTNGTVVKRDNQEFQLHDFKDRKVQLFDGDVVIIQEWKIRFFDPDKTKGKSFSSPPIDIIKSPWVFTVHCDTLYKVKADQREAVKLTPSEKKMIAYMASKNVKENGYPVLCSYEELRQAIWGSESESYECESLHNIVKNIRKKLQLVEDNDKHKWLGTQTGEGYILKIYCEK